ncbi:MAG: UDP-N-acetylglucosamine--LPS N-acetylglucosamine transferase, partial [Caldilineaceae bacterium]|nr:UDP-N-acetylglucosamine--LPS N-acetylglucosamine transferase [Caldilineaceae bacterium]
LLYEMYYDTTDVDEISLATTSNLLTDAIYTPFLQGLLRFVEKTAPDVIICTQQFPLAAISFLKQQRRLSQPLYVVVTDYMVHASWIAPRVEGYFVAHPQTGYVLQRRNVDPARIHATGIPIKLEVTRPKERDACWRQHELPLDRPIITLFGGGIEPKRVRLMVARLLEEAREPAFLVTVAGRNAELSAALSELRSGAQMGLRKLGLIDYVDDLVVASDVVITKAGGLIVSEVLARETPLVIIDPIPGQEEWNADFVAGSGAAVQLRMPEMVPPATLSLLGSPARLAQMQQAAAAMGRPRAALDIAGYILQQVQQVG